MRRATEVMEADTPEDTISIHALREESDMSDNVNHPKHYEFQSTLSVRRATVQLDIFVRFLRRKPAA